MTKSLSPPGKTEQIHANSVLVIAPHYDDEVLGCGGLICRLSSEDAAIRVLFLSDSGGEAQKETRDSYITRRRGEATAAMEVLGITGADHLALPDSRLAAYREEISSGLRRVLLSQKPELLLIPSPVEASADHRAAFQAVHELLGRTRRGDELWEIGQGLEILAYEVNHPQRPNVLVDISPQVEQLEKAMACYSSQQEKHDYLGASLGLARFRSLTLPPTMTHVEAYRRFSLQDFQTYSPKGLIHSLTGPAATVVEEGPLVSVIVRTKDRPQLLAEALSSLATSTYRRLEVVLVNDGGEVPMVAGDFPHPVISVNLETNQGRAAAANAGIAVTQGELVGFLDDDDLVEPDHFATLAGLFKAAGVRVAYTDAAIGVYELDAGEGWRLAERRLPYSRDYDPDLLLFDNYIPFNTLLIERELLLKVGELDSTLPFFEDWDLLIRLTALAPFHHSAQVTCEYRQFRGAGHHILGDVPRQRADFLAMKAKVLERHVDRRTAAVTSRVIDLLRAETVQSQEVDDRLQTELKEARAQFYRLNGRVAGLEAHEKALEIQRRTLQEEVRQTQQNLAEVRNAESQQSELLAKTLAEIERLNALIRDMESTRAWRLHRWWQGLKS